MPRCSRQRACPLVALPPPPPCMQASRAPPCAHNAATTYKPSYQPGGEHGQAAARRGAPPQAGRRAQAARQAHQDFRQAEIHQGEDPGPRAPAEEGGSQAGMLHRCPAALQHRARSTCESRQRRCSAGRSGCSPPFRSAAAAATAACGLWGATCTLPSAPQHQQDLDPKMRGRLEAKLEELRASAAEAARKELERKYAVRYHKVRLIALPFPLPVQPSAASRLQVLHAACRTAALHCHPCCWRVLDCTCQVQAAVVAKPHALCTAVAYA